ncbi:MAG: hypothetical protein NTY33_00200 [Candidatus Moranbacteria bacterium]|nr:hypothetical protein [Candidatus Moranbacteria bacterium]
MQINISERNKNRLYLVFSVVFVIIIIGIIAWIDRQEVDKKINEQATLMCAQKNAINQVGTNDSLSNQSIDANAPIKTKSEANNALKKVDDLIKSVKDDNLSAQ